MQQSKVAKKTITSTKSPVILVVDGQATAGIQVIGTYSGTLQFEGSLDGINWSSILFKVPSTGAESSSTTGTGIFVGSVAGLNYIRVRASALASGTPVVTIITSMSGSYNLTANVASGATDSGNPVKTGGVYNSTAPTLTDGQRGDTQMDASANTKVTQGTKLAGEDLVNDVMKVEERFSYSAVATADVQVKAGAGYLHSITISCNDAAPTAGSLIVYDSLTETGTQLFNHTFTTTPFIPTTIFLDVSFSTGLYLGFTTTADVNVTISYR